MIEALASAEKPTSVVELSQEAAFQRTYSNIHKAIDSMTTGSEQELEWAALFADFLPKSETNYHLFALDATSNPRPYAQTLDDRTYVHQSGPLGGQVAIGLQASLIAALPSEKEEEAKWTLPLVVNRISSDETPCQVAQGQLRNLSNLAAFKDKLCVIAADSGYTKMTPESQNQVIIARCRTDRTGRRPYRSSESNRRGRPRKYENETIHFEENIPLGDRAGPDEEETYESVYRKQKVTLLISRWKNVFVYGQKDLVDVVKVEVFPEDDLRPLFSKPLLLMAIGACRQHLSSLEIYKIYVRRFDIEHLFRFLKQKLLFCGYQTSCLRRQVNWWWLCLMAYWLLYLSRLSAPSSNRPWMPKRPLNRSASPGEVKRVFASRIFPKLCSPTSRPLTRGKSKGRPVAFRLPKRLRKKPIKKRAEIPKVA